MTFIYCSTDLGINSSGELVSKNELSAMKELGEETGNDIITFDYNDIHPTSVNYRLPDNPLFIDYIVLSKLLKMDLTDVRLAHFYGGCYSNTIQYLKSKSIKTTFTLMWHDRKISIAEHEKFFGRYPYEYVRDDVIFNMFTEGIRYADVVIAAGSAPRNNMLKERAKCVEIIPLGCDIPDEDKIVKLPLQEFKVGYLGQIGADKGLYYLIKAWESLNYLDSTLLFAGTNPEYLNQFINALAKAGKYHIMGYVNNVADFFNSIGIYVQPSATEGFGMTVIQAMSYGIPVICSEGAGAADCITNGEDGFIVPAMNSEAIADKIKYFKDNPQEIIRMGNNARIKSLKYTWRNTKDKYIRLWKELLVGTVKEVKEINEVKEVKEINEVKEVIDEKVKKVKEVKKLNIAVCTLCTSEIEDFAKYTTLNMKYYCQIHGYDYIEANDKNVDIKNNISPLHPYVHWHKVLLLYETLNTNKYDWVFWLDSDALFTNKDIKLEDIINKTKIESNDIENNIEVIVTQEEAGCCVISTGAMLIRNSEWSKNFLKAWYDKGELPNAQWRDQDTFHYFYYNDNEVRKKVSVLRQKVMNSFTSIFTDGDFIIHFAGRDRSPLRRFAYYKDPNYVSKRDEIPFLLNNLGLTGSGIEIGVQRGLYSATILYNSCLKKFYLCDPWKQLDANIYSDVANLNDEEQEKIFNEMVNRVRNYLYSKDRIIILRTTSNKVIESKLFKDEQLDFVYIDANHKYEYILEDIKNWYPKVRNGGIIAGHDYLDGERIEGSFGVKSAVTEFFGNNKNNERIYVTDEDWPSWYVIKNNKKR